MDAIPAVIGQLLDPIVAVGNDPVHTEFISEASIKIFRTVTIISKPSVVVIIVIEFVECGFPFT
jgi:hypothetical protein